MKKVLSLCVIVMLGIGGVVAQNKFWYGNVEIGAMQLVLTLEADNEITSEGVKAWFGSPMQSPMQFDVSGIKINAEDETISFGVPKLGFTFTGIVDRATGNLVGKFSQNGASFDLTFLKSDKPFTVYRPQTPKPPFPYDVKNVSIKSDENVTLAGTLTSPILDPKGKVLHPAVILVAGSGPNDRDETVFMHKPFYVIADYLTRHGYIVLRYDKRGIGKSTGDYKTATTFDFADDANAVFEYLRTIEGVDLDRVGIIGHSEGGMIAPMVAQKNPNVNFIMLLAAPSINAYEIMIRQNEYLYMRTSTPSNIQTNAMMVVKRAFELLLAGKSGEEFQNELVQAIEICKASLTPDEFKLTGFPTSKDEQIAFAKNFETPWFETFIKIKPAEYLKGLKIPVLAIYAGLDVQLYWEDNYPIMMNILKENGNKYSNTLKIDGVNHLFQPCSDGSVFLYGTIDETTSPKLLEQLNSWLGTITKAKKLIKK